MKKINFRNTKNIRFRRWSRSAFAVFCSLASCITIGCVAASISDKSLRKAVSSSQVSLSLIAPCNELADECKHTEEVEIEIVQVQEISLSNFKFESAAARIFLSTTIFFNQNG